MRISNLLFWSMVTQALPHATPITHKHTHLRRTNSPSQLTPSALLQIAPTSSTCDGAPFPSECATAETAAPLIAASFAKYNITHAAVQAALVSLMAYESGEFKYNVNHFPGVPGQGTRDMQSPTFNIAYAEYLGFGAEVTGDVDVLMQTLGQPEYTFGSAAWFVTTQCAYSFREGMWDGSRSGWEAYITGCVNTQVDEERLDYWTRAMAVLGA